MTVCDTSDQFPPWAMRREERNSGGQKALSHWIPAGVYQDSLESDSNLCLPFDQIKPVQTHAVTRKHKTSLASGHTSEEGKAWELSKASHCFSPEAREFSMSWELVVDSQVQFSIFLWRCVQGTGGPKSDCHNKERGVQSDCHRRQSNMRSQLKWFGRDAKRKRKKHPLCREQIHPTVQSIYIWVTFLLSESFVILNTIN